MRILIVAVGSRGDVAPYTGLGIRLRDAGHEVAIAAYRRFDDMVTQCGLEFRPLPGDSQDQFTSADGQRWLRAGTGPRGLVRIFQIVNRDIDQLNRGMVEAAAKGTDLLLLSMPAISGYHIAEAMNIPSMGVFVQPMTPTGEFSPAMVSLARSLGQGGNKLAAALVLVAMARYFDGSTQRLRASLGLPRISATAMGERIAQWPVCHGFSEVVVPRPRDWPDNLHVSGYWWPEHPPGWQPPAALLEFMAAGPPPVFAGFGSMMPRFVDLGDIMAQAMRRAGVRGIIYSGWAGLSVSDDNLFVIDDLPFDWLFPRLAAVVHHAGAGTTATSLRAGVPVVPVPMIHDQQFWSWRLERLGVSPGAVPLRRLTVARLADRIRAVVADDGYRQRAEAVARRIQADDGAGRVAELVARMAG